MTKLEENPSPSMAELFARDPEHLSPEDIKVIVASMRAARVDFKAKASAPKVKAVPKPKTERGQAVAAAISLVLDL